MLKARYVDRYVQLYEPFRNIKYNLSKTSWEIIKLIKKYGKDKAVPKIMKLFNIGEKNAKEDIETILYNLELLKIKIEDIPTKISREKYAPRTVHFDITTKCNLKCIYCYATDRLSPRKELTTKQILRLLNELAELDTWTIVISGGEPFLRRDIFKILGHINELEIMVSILTNGTLITDNVAKKLASFDNLQMIQVSLDSYNPEHHELHRGVKGVYEKTLNGIKNLKKYGITPDIEIVVTPINVKDIERTVEFLHQLKIKKITIGPVFTGSGRGRDNKNKLTLDENTLIKTGKKLQELKERYKETMCIAPNREFFVYTTERRIHKQDIICGVGKSILYISPDGLVYPCLFSINPETFLGDIKKQSLREIWKNSSLLKKYRRSNLPDIEKCKKCDFRYIYDLIIH